MTVEGRELPQPHNPLKEQLIRRHTLFPVPWILPITLLFLGILAVFGIFITSGISALALLPVSELLAISWACHFWLCSLQHSLFRFPLPGPTLLAQPNSTHSAQLTRPNSLGPAHSAQLTRPTHPNSTRLAWPNSLGPDSPNSTRPTQLARPNSLAPAHSTQPSSPGPTQSTQLAQPAM